MLFFAILAAALLLVTVAASFGAAVTPWAPPLLLGATYASARAFLGPSSHRVVGIALLFVGGLTIPAGLLTHGVVSGGEGPFRAAPYASPLSERPLVDRVDYDGGVLLSYADPDSLAPVLAFRKDGTTEWASAIPFDLRRSSSGETEPRVGALRELTVAPVLWRVRVNVYATGVGAPGWCYVWRWGGVQKCYLLTEK